MPGPLQVRSPPRRGGAPLDRGGHQEGELLDKSLQPLPVDGQAPGVPAGWGGAGRGCGVDRRGRLLACGCGTAVSGACGTTALCQPRACLLRQFTHTARPIKNRRTCRQPERPPPGGPSSAPHPLRQQGGVWGSRSGAAGDPPAAPGWALAAGADMRAAQHAVGVQSYSSIQQVSACRPHAPYTITSLFHQQSAAHLRSSRWL